MQLLREIGVSCRGVVNRYPQSIRNRFQVITIAVFFAVLGFITTDYCRFNRIPGPFLNAG